MAALAVMCTGTSAGAAITYTTDPGVWTATAGGPGAVKSVDFGTIPLFQIVTEQFAGLGVHFTDGDDFRAATLGSPSYAILVSSPHLSTPPPTSITLKFDSTQFAISFLAMNSGQPLLFYLGERLVMSYEVPTLQSPYFVGLFSDAPFDRVVVDHFPDANFATLTNFEFSSVPTPAPLVLLALVSHLARRRRCL